MSACWRAGNYMLGYLASKGPSLEPFVISGFIQLLCRVTKLGWFDEGDVMRQLVSETTKFLEVCRRGRAICSFCRLWFGCA